MKRLLIFKKVQIAYIAFVLLAVFASCSKDDKDKDKERLIENTWKVEYIVSGGSVMYLRDFYQRPTSGSGDPFLNLLFSMIPMLNRLSFMNGSFIFSLERNVVTGTVKIGKNNKIDFQIESGEQPSENEFTITCTHLLENVSQYKIDGNNLVLTGNKGKIHLKSKSISF